MLGNKEALCWGKWSEPGNGAVGDGADDEAEDDDKDRRKQISEVGMGK